MARAATARLCLLAAVAAALVHTAEAADDRTRDIRELTGARTRVVWVQDPTGRDTFATGDNLRLVGFDTDDGKGERTILTAATNYAKPLITPKGDRIVFSNRQTRKVLAVNWDGSGLKELADGFAMDVWCDWTNGTEWVYVGTGELRDKGGSLTEIRRHPIDAPGAGERVWEQAPVSQDSFQLSADGTRACGLFPWPQGGLATLPNAAWKPLGKGCWTSLAPDNSHLLWVFDGAHRNVVMHPADGGQPWRVSVNGAPGFGGLEAYHPRWSNHPRFLALTGPYKVGSGGNRIRGGGPEVEVFLGRFAPDLRSVERWVKVSSNATADLFPDAWIEGGEKASLAGLAANPPGTEPKAGPAKGPARPRQPAPLFTARAKLIAKTEIPPPDSIAPYRRALAVYAYEAAQPLDTVQPGQQFLVAHWAIVDKKIVPPASDTIGQTYGLMLERYADHPELESERLLITVDEMDLPMYVDAPGKGRRQ